MSKNEKKYFNQLAEMLIDLFKSRNEELSKKDALIAARDLKIKFETDSNFISSKEDLEIFIELYKMESKQLDEIDSLVKRELFNISNAPPGTKFH